MGFLMPTLHLLNFRLHFQLLLPPLDLLLHLPLLRGPLSLRFRQPVNSLHVAVHCFSHVANVVFIGFVSATRCPAKYVGAAPTTAAVVSRALGEGSRPIVLHGIMLATHGRHGVIRSLVCHREARVPEVREALVCVKHCIEHRSAFEKNLLDRRQHWPNVMSDRSGAGFISRGRYLLFWAVATLPYGLDSIEPSRRYYHTLAKVEVHEELEGPK
jgi:hypothetical protein